MEDDYCDHCKELAHSKNLHRRANERAAKAEKELRIERNRAKEAQALADRHLAQADSFGAENERLRVLTGKLQDGLAGDEEAKIRLDTEIERLKRDAMDHGQEYAILRDEHDQLRSSRKEACQTIIRAIGADGPESVEMAAERAAEEVLRLRGIVGRQQACIGSDGTAMRSIRDVLLECLGWSSSLSTTTMLACDVRDTLHEYEATPPEMATTFDPTGEKALAHAKLEASNAKAMHASELMLMKTERDVARMKFGTWMAKEWQP